MEDWIWFIIFVTTILWYFIVTIIVAFRGAKNIVSLIKNNRRE